MFNATRKNLMNQIENLKLTFIQQDGLPFGDLLTDDYLYKLVAEKVGNFRDRIFSPMVTLTAFISQVLSKDHSCREAVSRIQADRLAQGKSKCSINTAGYCQARKRLPESFITSLLKETGARLHSQGQTYWEWKGQNITLVDGSTVSMPDTPDNQKSFLNLKLRKKVLGFL